MEKLCDVKSEIIYSPAFKENSCEISLSKVVTLCLIRTVLFLKFVMAFQNINNVSESCFSVHFDPNCNFRKLF